jgi:hypothetical protein
MQIFGAITVLYHRQRLIDAMHPLMQFTVLQPLDYGDLLVALC